jgi:hypothetical protein
LGPRAIARHCSTAWEAQQHAVISNLHLENARSTSIAGGALLFLRSSKHGQNPITDVPRASADPVGVLLLQAVAALTERRISVERAVNALGEAPSGLKDVFELCRGFERAFQSIVNVSAPLL